MSGATYRIDVEHTPGEVFAWYARVYSMSDDNYPLHVLHHDNGLRALELAREWVAAQNIKRPTQTIYVGDDGQDAEAPHSVKV